MTLKKLKIYHIVLGKTDRMIKKYWDKKTKYTVILIIVFSFLMITFKNELTLIGFVSLIISGIINVGMFYLYSKERDKNEQ